jgi:hypothetical protein
MLAGPAAPAGSAVRRRRANPTRTPTTDREKELNAVFIGFG